MSSSEPPSSGNDHVKQAAGDNSSSVSEATALRANDSAASSGRGKTAVVAALATPPATLTRHASTESIFTPPGSPGGFHKEQSVKELFKSAREAFGGQLQPQKGYLEALEHPVRRGPSMMVTEQEWTAMEGKVAPAAAEAAAAATAAAAAAARGGVAEEEEEEEEPWRPPSPQPSPPRARRSLQKLPSCFKEDEEEAEEKAAGTDSELTVVSSAPGKVILFGEHAVVYGKTAVGAAVSDLRIVAAATCTIEPVFVVELPDLGVSLRRTTKQVAAALGFSLAVAPGAKAAPPGSSHLDLISAFLGDGADQGWSKEGKKALVPLVFLALSIVPDIFQGKAGPGARGLSLTAFSASLPVGAGLGSSAALCVATSAALTRLADTISRGGDYSLGSKPGQSAGGAGGAGEGRGETGDAAAGGEQGAGVGEGVEDGGCGGRPPPSELERINAWAFAGETVLHGTPSGLDNTVSCYGGAIRFVKGMDGAANTTEPLLGFPPLPVLLTNTLVPKNTMALVAGVRRLLEAHRGPTSATFDAIGEIAAEFVKRAGDSAAAAAAAAPAEGGVLENGSYGGGGGEGGEAEPLPLTAECVGELAEMNHRLLCALGVGHPALERVCEVSGAHGCRSKLTGAGGGGCALTILLGEDLSKASLVKDLEEEGFKCYESSLGGDGVLWHGKSVPPEFLTAAAAAAARDRGGTEAGSEESAGFSALLADRKGKVLGIAAAAALVAVAAVASIVVVGFGRRGSRW